MSTTDPLVVRTKPALPVSSFFLEALDTICLRFGASGYNESEAAFGRHLNLLSSVSGSATNQSLSAPMTPFVGGSVRLFLQEN